ncbi:hypothetical protein [Paenibacillus sp. UNC499MF]|uniref:hypothetical protein n=1 Tax=Paenibacillus sp. UNC499MF TaxID=1502751 RepID=UPI00089FDC8C|nr:hypothetical protein [Paenibacillus sp. UNC499MF]SEG04625.1 hypothetical protein SAMN02799616_01659 [Paenibacillus sp. UNC499MF]
MFDPTVYENLKVVLEGTVYDLDLSGEILVTNRSDVMDLSSLGRHYRIRFVLRGGGENTASPWAELHLEAKLEDLAAELLSRKGAEPGCTLTVKFGFLTHDPSRDCPAAGSSLESIWSGRPLITQTLSYVFGSENEGWHNEVLLEFGRKVNESHLDDFEGLLEHTLLSLSVLRDNFAS